MARSLAPSAGASPAAPPASPPTPTSAPAAAPRGIPYEKDIRRDHSTEAVTARQRFVAEQSGRTLEHVTHFPFSPEETVGNIEGLTGTAQVPLVVMVPPVRPVVPASAPAALRLGPTRTAAGSRTAGPAPS